MRQIIYLDPQDNIATIREKLEHAQASEVLLVVPPRFQELRNLPRTLDLFHKFVHLSELHQQDRVQTFVIKDLRTSTKRGQSAYERDGIRQQLAQSAKDEMTQTRILIVEGLH